MSFVSWMTRSWLAICASVSRQASRAARVIFGGVAAATSRGVFLYLRFFLGAASSGLASGSGAFSSAGFSSALASFSSGAFSSAFSSGLASGSSGTSCTSCAEATVTVPCTSWLTFTRTREAPAGTPLTVNSPSVASAPGGRSAAEPAWYAAVMVKSSPRRNVRRLCAGVSPLRGKSTTPLLPSASPASSPSPSADSSMGVDTAGQLRDTAKGAASRIWYSFTLKRGDRMAACMARPLDTHSSAFSVVLRP
mmetsp:Transcript_24036/g.72102  ORF Transcript_24036/g.72102 Transcript_24036/m.72102 type:complete len:251 (-) Transcript_24036:1267-2019(-)